MANLKKVKKVYVCPTCKGNGFVRIPYRLAKEEVTAQCGVCNSEGEVDAESVDDIIIDNDTITTTASNGDINITTNGVGQVIIDNIQLSGNTVANPGGDIVLDPSSQTVTISSTGALTLPKGYLRQVMQDVEHT